MSNQIDNKGSIFENNSRIIYVTGPSGVGKDTLIRQYFEHYKDIVSKIVAYTTRKKREGEIEGRDYYFVEKGEYSQKYMIESLEYNGNYYGVTKEEIISKLPERKLLFGQANFEGVFNIIEKLGNIDEKLLKKVIVFGLKGSFNVIKDRLENRGTESKKEIRQRLKDVENYLRWYDDRFNSTNEVDNGPVKLIDTDILDSNGVFHVSAISLLKDIINDNQNNSADRNAPIFDALLRGIDSKYFNSLNSNLVKNFNF